MGRIINVSIPFLIVTVLTVGGYCEVIHNYNESSVHWTSDLLVGNGYNIRWNNEDPDYLIMEISAPVKGYVSVGFSPNGAMRGSDIVMGWVDSTGTAHLKVNAAESSAVLKIEFVF